jgi:alcohol dehydrogenase
MNSHCEGGGGWILGHLINGTQAEYVRIPFADTSLYLLPEGLDEAGLVMLSDIFPTGFECGIISGAVKPGDVVAIVGAGPIGLATLLTAQFYSPAEVIMIDPDQNRLEVAKHFGATGLIRNVNGEATETVLRMTGGTGVDVAIEAVGIPRTFELCESIVRPGGHIANIGVHGKSAELHLEKLWGANITITTRLVDTITTPMLLKMVRSGKLLPQKMITHRFGLDEIMRAYDVFGNAAREKALKVVLSADGFGGE